MGNCLSPNTGKNRTAAVGSAEERQAQVSRSSRSRKASRENILGDRKGKVEDFYDIGRELGRGQFGVTREAVEKKTGQHVAVKTLPKRFMTRTSDLENVNREVEILKYLSGHPNIVSYIAAYEDKENVHLVMELCAGGMLFDRITERGHYSEYEAAGIMRTMVEVVAYMHSKGVFHRDLKPENFLLSDRSERAELKAIDFGLSTFYKPGQTFTDLVGSAYYVAPEVLLRRYSAEADVWSLGVILYILLCGVPPFWHFSERGIMDAVLKGEVDLTSEPWPSISESAKDLIRKMLAYEPKLRITPSQVLEHSWIRVGGDAPRQAICCSVQLRVRQFLTMNRLKRVALNVIAMTVKEAHGDIRTLFEKFDEDGSGVLTKEKLAVALHRIRSAKGLPDVPEHEIQEMIRASDVDGNGVLDFTEFLTATMTKNDKVGREDNLRAAFEHFDIDRDGFITSEELKERLGGEGPEREKVVEDILLEVDGDGDGKIDFAEFTRMMQTGNGPDELTAEHKEQCQRVFGLAATMGPTGEPEPSRDPREMTVPSRLGVATANVELVAA